MLPWSYDEDIKKISLIYFIFNNIKCHQISALTIIFLGNFCRHGIKTRKSWLIFFFQVSVMSILATNSNRWHEKQFQSLNVVWTIIWNSVELR